MSESKNVDEGVEPADLMRESTISLRIVKLARGQKQHVIRDFAEVGHWSW